MLDVVCGVSFSFSFFRLFFLSAFLQKEKFLLVSTVGWFFINLGQIKGVSGYSCVKTVNIIECGLEVSRGVI